MKISNLMYYLHFTKFQGFITAQKTDYNEDEKTFEKEFGKRS